MEFDLTKDQDIVIETLHRPRHSLLWSNCHLNIIILFKHLTNTYNTKRSRMDMVLEVDHIFKYVNISTEQVLCLIVVIHVFKFLMDSCGIFIHILQGCFTGIRTIGHPVRLRCQWNNPQSKLQTEKHDNAWTLQIFFETYILWIYILHTYIYSVGPYLYDRH